MGTDILKIKEICKDFTENLSVNLDESTVTIKGMLYFNSHYDAELNAFFPISDEVNHQNYIEDFYQIEINFNHEKLTRLPVVKEIGNKIKKMVGMKGISDITDLHLNKDGTACLCVAVDEDKYINSFELENFINKLIIPFFYAQSYYKKYESWPWPNYCHGIFGILQRYLEEPIINKSVTNKYLAYLRRQAEYNKLLPLLKQKRKVKETIPCICGSQKKFLKCHKSGLELITKFKKDLKGLSYNIKKIY